MKTIRVSDEFHDRVMHAKLNAHAKSVECILIIKGE